MIIDIKSLEDFSTTIDDHPFTGERILKTPMTVRLRDIPENWFSETSLLGSSKSDFYEDVKSDGLFKEKTYNCIGVYGYGDVFDLLIKMDSGKVEKFFSSIFEQVPIILEANYTIDQRKDCLIHREKCCGTCKHCYEGHYEDKGEKPYIKRKCTNKYGLNNGYSIYENDFCSRWEANDGYTD